jgi:hypothetical protein
VQRHYGPNSAAFRVRFGAAQELKLKTVKLYDRTGDEITLDEVERITI